MQANATGRGRSSRIGLCAILVLFTAAILASAQPGAFACITCDSGKNCHPGAEQGAYLCESGEVSCSFLLKLFGAGCGGRWCRTAEICDNRRFDPDLDSAQAGPPACEPDASTLPQELAASQD